MAIARAWVDYTADSEEANDWVLLRLFDVGYEGSIEEQWLMLLSRCAAASQAELEVVAVLGAGFLEDFIKEDRRGFGDEAMDLIEPQLASNPTLLYALRGSGREMTCAHGLSAHSRRTGNSPISQHKHARGSGHVCCVQACR
ncbi:MAG TPA: hypothetical protein VHX66_13695 [Solirubrobacteraceae bacterium]|nr:hypothetical protein [Solirubrobacteraceae bacterium]